MTPSGIGDWIHRRRVKSAGSPALVWNDGELTYDQLAERVDRLANALRDRGVAPGDRVAYLGDNHPSLVETLFAVTLAGAIFVPLNTRLSVPELEYQVNDCDARLVVSSATLAANSRAAAGGREIVVIGDEYEALIASGSPEHPGNSNTLDDPALIIYTSGTTGKPKGAVLSHGNLTWNSLNVLVDYDVTSDTRALMIAPLFHVASLGMGCLPTLLKGGAVVVAERFVPSEALAWIERHRITSMSGVPTTFQLMLEDPAWATTDLSSLRSLTCGGSAVPERVRLGFEERGLSFSNGYGMTETSPGVTSLSPRYSVSKGRSSGVAHFFTEVRIAPDEESEGEAGEIQVRGPNVFTHYWNNPQATADTFTDDGWLRTGDLGVQDEEGFVTIVDRAKDMIISGGENIYSAEVEQAIMTIPNVTGAAVIGIPHERWGEAPHAIVTLQEGTTLELDWFVSYLSERLARYKVPRTLEIVDELPRTASGKIQKHRLRRS
ncbi:MAG TPA: long-chain fatty acid--CoA ligase [Protaetiibacter sp.]|nr:long-chain fatty acid--CoA ligase [Protaetiibacter sp.]